jgi:hypothetical protein
MRSGTSLSSVAASAIFSPFYSMFYRLKDKNLN